MKALLFFSLILITLSLHAQYSVLKVIVKPGKTRGTEIDGKGYPADNLYRDGKGNEYTITDMQPGQHTICVISRRNVSIETSFTLSSNYDMTIQIARNGELLFAEQRNSELGTDVNCNMKNKDFNAFLRTLKAIKYNSQKEFALTEAFLNPGYYFSDSQIIEMLQLVTDDARPKLAELSYASLLDHTSFYNIINSFSNTLDQERLRLYINDITGFIPVASMSIKPFTDLKRNIDTQRFTVEKDKAIMTAFLNTGNRFSTNQAGQLIEMSGTEKAREQLTEAAFGTLSDPGNYTSLYSLLGSQDSRNSISLFVFGTGTDVLSRLPNAQRAEMSAIDFSDVVNETVLANKDNRTQILLDQFACPYAGFSSSQIRKLVQLVKSESDRLLLLKRAYRVTTNRDNFNSLYDLLSSDNSRRTLTIYQAAYHGK